jgi:hypothetical protein
MSYYTYPPCECSHCLSEGFDPQTSDCLYWQAEFNGEGMITFAPNMITGPSSSPLTFPGAHAGSIYEGPV